MRKIMSSHIILMLCILILLGGCNQLPPKQTEGSGAVENEPAFSGRISDFIPDITSVDELSVRAGYTSASFFGGWFYVVANKEERENLLAYLVDADTSGFSNAEKIGVTGESISLRVKTAKEVYVVQIIENNDAQYLSVTYSNGNQVFLKGPPDSFSFIDIDRTKTSVLTNKTDINNAGFVSIIGKEDSKYAIAKGIVAEVRNILDGTIDKAGSNSADGDIRYDIQLTVGQSIYSLNTKTGQLSRKQAEEIMYGKLESMWLKRVRFFLGVSSNQ